MGAEWRECAPACVDDGAKIDDELESERSWHKRVVTKGKGRGNGEEGECEWEKRNETYKTSLETVLPSLSSRKSVMGVRVSVPVQLGPPDRIILISASSLHAPDRASDEGEQENTSGDADANDGSC